MRGQKRSSSGSGTLRGKYCYKMLWTWTIFLLFSDFIGILFFFSFLFRDDEEARDIAVT